MAGEEVGLDKTDTRENSNLSPSYLNSILKTDGISQQSISFSQEIKKNDINISKTLTSQTYNYLIKIQKSMDFIGLDLILQKVYLNI